MILLFCSIRNFEWRNLNKFHCSFALSRGVFYFLFIGTSDKNGFFNLREVSIKDYTRLNLEASSSLSKNIGWLSIVYLNSQFFPFFGLNETALAHERNVLECLLCGETVAVMSNDQFIINISCWNIKILAEAGNLNLDLSFNNIHWSKNLLVSI